MMHLSLLLSAVLRFGAFFAIIIRQKVIFSLERYCFTGDIRYMKKSEHREDKGHVELAIVLAILFLILAEAV